MFTPINEYMQLSKEERQAHLDLNSDCIEIGGNSPRFRGLLAHYLKTTIPSGMKIHLCHACHNEKCSNPQHLYWGTAKENLHDSGTCWDRMVAKYGKEVASNVIRSRQDIPKILERYTPEVRNDHAEIARNAANIRVKNNTHNWQYQEKHICPHCGKDGIGSVMFRHHFDKCKNKGSAMSGNTEAL